MAADISAKPETSNPCCRVWEDKYKKSQGNRTALRQALKLFEQQLDKIQAENLSLKKACQEEKARAEVEKKGREEVLAAKVSLENEISALNSEICILQQKKGVSSAQSVQEVKLLDIRLTEKEREIKQLRGEVEKEKIRADSEKKNAEVEKKRAAEAWKCVEAEKGKAEEERKHANIEGKKAEEYKLQLEALRKDADDAKTKLVSESSKLGDITKKLESEKQKVSKEKKRANNEGKKAEEYRIQLEALRKEADDAKLMLVSEASKSEAVSKKLEAEKQMVCKERQRANIEGKKAEEYRLQLEALRKEADDAKSMLVSEASKSEALRKRLEAEKQMLSKEREHVHLEMAKGEDQRKLAEASRKQAVEEKRHAERLSQQLEEAGQRIVELQKEINDLVSRHSVDTHGCKPGTDAGFLKMKNGSKVNILQRVGEEPNLGLDIMKFEEASRRFGPDKQKSDGVKELTDLDMIKPQEQRKVVQCKCLAADYFSQQLEDARGRIDELQKQIHDLHSSQVDKYFNADSGKLKLLKKQLKFEKMQVKHAKQVAKLEKDRNTILHQELGRLKLDFVQFLHRLDTVDQCFSSNAEGIDNVGNVKVRDISNMQILKLKESLPVQMYLQSENELEKHCCTDVAASSPLRQTIQHIAPSFALSGGICSESMSGIDSKDPKLESLLGGSSRKMLQSSAINSSSASFSDRQLMGSQERGAFSFTTSSKLMNAQATNSSMSDGINRVRCDGKPTVDAEISVRSPLKIGATGKVNGPSRKRKRLLHAVESIALLHSEDRKLHLQIEEKLSDLHNILNKQLDKSPEEANYAVANNQDAFKHDQLPKKRRVSQEENLGIQHLCDSGEMNKAANLDAKIHEETAQACTEGITDTVIGHHESMMNFEEVADGDYMKLLDLDNPADEECYRAAMEFPLSPTLPEIEFPALKTFDISKFEPLSGETFCGGLSKEKENSVPSHSYDVIDVEINSNKLNHNISGNSHNSLSYESESPLDSFGVQVDGGNISVSAKQAGKACDNWALEKLVISDKCRSGDRGEFPFASELGPEHDNIPGYFVVPSNIKDESSISRIYCATKSCMARCSLVYQTEWILQKILLALEMEEQLFSKERACVFLSLLLLNFSTTAWEKFRDCLNSDVILCLDSFANHFNAVMSDAKARRVFDELCLDELLSLIEDFLMNGKVMTCTDLSSETLSESNSKINILLDGVDTTWSSEAASASQLTAGSIILASIATETDSIGFICEASYNIFRKHVSDPSLVLMILHIFTYLGGEKIFTSGKCDLTMTVLKSIVMSLERGCSSVAANSSISLADEIQSKFHPCADCPFSKDAVSIEIAVSLLLEKLQSFAESQTVNVLFHNDRAEQSCQEPYCLLDINCGTSGSLNNCKMSALQSKSAVNAALCHVTDVLSLVELLSCIMSWDWTLATVVPDLLRMLELPIADSFTIAIVILLGQLGRVGVAAHGYEDKNVENLRNTLSALLWHETTTRAGFPLQIAIVTAMLGLISVDFEQVIEVNSMGPFITSQSAVAGAIRKWFSSLSKEHQALSFSLFQSSALVPNVR